MAKTLLLADDSVTIQKVVGISFANEDVRLITVDNGDDAIARAREARPDVILADVVMPGRSGYEVCEAVKSDPSLRHVPVLLLTGTFEAFDEERARSAGADGHITKPFEAQALVDHVNELLRRTPEAAPEAPAASAQAPAAAPATSEEDAFDFLSDEDAGPSPDDAEEIELESEDDAFAFADPGASERPTAPDRTVAILPGDEGSLRADADDEEEDRLSDSTTDTSAFEFAFEAPPEEPAPPVALDPRPDPPTEVAPGAADSSPFGEPPRSFEADAFDTAAADLGAPAEAPAEPVRAEPEPAPEPPLAGPGRPEPEPDPEAPEALPELEPLAEPVAAEPAAASGSAEGGREIPAELRGAIHDTLEKMAWESFGDLAERIVRESVERVEAVAWEVIPQMAEALIREEIRRLKEEDEG